MMLQHDSPDSYIIATGATRSLENFCRVAFEAAGLEWRDCVSVARYGGAVDKAHPLCGNTAHARRRLLWEPEVSFSDMIRMMVETDLDRLSPKQRLRPELVAAPDMHWSMP